jgi:molybdate-binding protein/molybdenum-dependent DNA-binding transcriptional regulator ModE
MQIKIRPAVHIEKKKHHTVESIDLTWVAGLLRGVQNGRSLQSAADAMEMSYRTLWNRLKAAEKALDCRLMMSVKGHGSSLTAAAKTFLQIVDEVEQQFEGLGRTQEKKLQERLSHLEDAIHKKWLVCASNDPILEHFIVDSDTFELRTMGSGQSLERLLSGEADLAGFHVPDDDSIPAVRRRLAVDGVQAYPVMRRTQGLMVGKGNPLQIRELKDLARPEVRFINRQRGAGTRLLLDKLLDAQGLASQKIKGYQREEFTHTAVATAILAGTADVGMGLKSVAMEYGLDFIPFGNETYFLAMTPQMVKRSAVSELIRNVRKKASQTKGYEEVKLRQKQK